VAASRVSRSANKSSDDQKRFVDIEEAFDRGADYLMIGLPIRGAAEALTHATAQRCIADHFA